MSLTGGGHPVCASEAYTAVVEYCVRSMHKNNGLSWCDAVVPDEASFLCTVSRLVWFMNDPSVAVLYNVGLLKVAVFTVACKIEYNFHSIEAKDLRNRLLADEGIPNNKTVNTAITSIEFDIVRLGRFLYHPTSASSMLDDMLERGGIAKLGDNAVAMSCFRRAMALARPTRYPLIWPAGTLNGMIARESDIALECYADITR